MFMHNAYDAYTNAYAVIIGQTLRAGLALTSTGDGGYWALFSRRWVADMCLFIWPHLWKESEIEIWIVARTTVCVCVCYVPKFPDN